MTILEQIFRPENAYYLYLYILVILLLVLAVQWEFERVLNNLKNEQKIVTIRDPEIDRIRALVFSHSATLGKLENIITQSVSKKAKKRKK